MSDLVAQISKQEAAFGRLQPFAGENAQTPYLANAETKLHRKLCGSLEEAIQRSGLKDGMVISFHHAFREGDKVVNKVVDTLAGMEFKNLTLASSSLLNCHDPLVAHIRSGVITQIYTSGMRGKLAEAAAASQKAMQFGTRDSLLLYHAGIIAEGLGQREQARAELKQALEINPHFHLIYANAAQDRLAALEAQSESKEGSNGHGR